MSMFFLDESPTKSGDKWHISTNGKLAVVSTKEKQKQTPICPHQAKLKALILFLQKVLLQDTSTYSVKNPIFLATQRHCHFDSIYELGKCFFGIIAILKLIMINNRTIGFFHALPTSSFPQFGKYETLHDNT